LAHSSSFELSALSRPLSAKKHERSCETAAAFPVEKARTFVLKSAKRP